MAAIKLKCVYTFKQGDSRNICCKVKSDKIENMAFEGSNIKSAVIPETVENIGLQSFCECAFLENITIPASVTTILDSAFNSCTSLSYIKVMATTPPTLEGEYQFYNTNNCPIYVPNDSVAAYKTAEGWSEYSDRIKSVNELQV